MLGNGQAASSVRLIVWVWSIQSGIELDLCFIVMVAFVVPQLSYPPALFCALG